MIQPDSVKCKLLDEVIDCIPPERPKSLMKNMLLMNGMAMKMRMQMKAEMKIVLKIRCPKDMCLL